MMIFLTKRGPMEFRFALCIVAIVSWIGTALAVDGIALSVAWKSSSPEHGGIFRGQLVRYDIKSNTIDKRQVIVDRDKAIVCYPAFNYLGTRIAFYRDRKIVVNNQVQDLGKCYISVVNADGTGLTNLTSINDLPDEETAIDWPVGDWIYYVKPMAGTNPWDRVIPDVWRVNVNDPSQNSLLVTETDVFRRFSLSLDAKHMGDQMVNTGGSYIKSFPGLVKEHENCGCNGAVSASGKYLLNYCGWHGEISFTSEYAPSERVITVSQLEQWTNASNICGTANSPIESGCGGELMVWSVNSDKWSCHWPGVLGWADGMSHGTNFVLVNWIDNQAICLTTYTQGSAGEYSGDFWVNGGSAAAGKYEDVGGAWVAVPGYSTGARESSFPDHYHDRLLEIRRNAVSARPGHGSCGIVDIIDMQGRVMRSGAGRGMISVRTSDLARGTYLAIVTTGNDTRVSRFAKE